MPRSEPGLLVMCFYMEQDIGFEPMTFSLATKHSTTELILHIEEPLRKTMFHWQRPCYMEHRRGIEPLFLG
jgi:hypothetical protein